MSRLLKRLHPRSAPAGLEIAILRRVPLIAVAITVIPLLLSAGVRIRAAGAPAAEMAKQVATVDIQVAALIVTLWTALVTVAIGAFIVYLMKGPAFVADAYPLDSASQPRPPGRTPERWP